MLPRHTTKNKVKTGERYTQTEAAKRLGVTRWHLNRVLRGHRESRSLTRRYHELQRGDDARAELA